jgi:hypothetical protein
VTCDPCDGGVISLQHAGVQYILDSVTTALEADPNKKFTYVEQVRTHTTQTQRSPTTQMCHHRSRSASASSPLSWIISSQGLTLLDLCVCLASGVLLSVVVRADAGQAAARQAARRRRTARLHVSRDRPPRHGRVLTAVCVRASVVQERRVVHARRGGGALRGHDRPGGLTG